MTTNKPTGLSPSDVSTEKQMKPAEAARKILFIDHSGLPGGGQLGLARYLAATTLKDVHLAILGPGNAFDDLKSRANIQVMMVDSDTTNPLKLRSGLIRTIRKIQPTLIVANSNKSALLLASISRRKRPTSLYYMRDDLNPQRKSWLKRVLLGRWMIPSFDLTIANSNWTLSTIPRMQDRRDAQIAYPVSGISASETTDRAPHPKLRLLSLSRIAHWKGIHVLLEAVQLLEQEGYANSIEVTIAGTSLHEDPDYEKSMWETATKLKSPITFVGHVSDTSSILREHDVLVACSVSPEPFGQVVVQGLANGLVTIASAEGGPTEVITSGETGFLIPPNDAAALKNVILRLILKPEQVPEIGRSASTSAMRFLDSSTVARLDDIIQNVVHAHNA